MEIPHWSANKVREEGTVALLLLLLLFFLFFCFVLFVACVLSDLPLGVIGVIVTTLDIFYTTDNPLYTDTRYNDKIRYNNNLTVTKLSLKR